MLVHESAKIPAFPSPNTCRARIGVVSCMRAGPRQGNRLTRTFKDSIPGVAMSEVKIKAEA